MEKADTAEVKLAHLKNLRRGKKGSATKRIAQITQLILDSGSRTKIKKLFIALASLFAYLEGVCKEIEEIYLSQGLQVPHEDLDWLEDEKLRLDTCASDIATFALCLFA